MTGPAWPLRPQSLQFRLMLLGGTVTALVVGAAFLFLRARAVGDVRRVFAEELAGSQRSLRALQERNLKLLLATSSLVTTSPTLRAALETARVEANAGVSQRSSALITTIRGEAQRVFDELDRDLLIVTDDQGEVLVSVGRGSLGTMPRISQLPAVRQALESDAPRPDSSFGVIHIGNQAYQVGCVAIVLQGFPIGVLVLGDRLDQLVTSFGATAGNDVVITEGNEVLASQPTRTPEEVRAAALSEPATDSVPRRVRFGSDEYVAASLPLGATPANKQVTLHVLRSLGGAVGPLERSLGRSFLVAGLLAVILATLGAAAVARTTIEPLRRFVTFLESGAQRGALEPFEEASTTAEIEALTGSYNTMMASLARQHEQLEERRHQLVSANESLVEEIRQRTRAEESLRASEEALRQSQKLEALGTLAGGVAHDFNNLITVITGYAELLTRELPVESPVRHDIQQIDQAAERASGLVRQLLAFSRKQVLQPRILDLNHVVGGMDKMLQRLLPEDVSLETHLDPSLERVTADPGSVEQVIMNLVVNARDAMPNGGRIRVETANVALGAEYEHRPEALPAGPAVMLSVSDTGMGMDPGTRARIFEPFFTTKGPGKGTGLGLSTVYGIVRQTGGSISVYSQPGEGTTFRVYFPVSTSGAEAPAPEPVRETWPTGTETVLLAEDEDQVRTFVQRVLEGQGYRVLAAANGAEALAMADAQAGQIHLLVSDVVMPSMSGPELAKLVRKNRPSVHVIFLSGYSADAIARHGVLAPDSVFLQKPVTPGALARLVRQVLDRNGASHA